MKEQRSGASYVLALSMISAPLMMRWNMKDRAPLFLPSAIRISKNEEYM